MGATVAKLLFTRAALPRIGASLANSSAATRAGVIGEAGDTSYFLTRRACFHYDTIIAKLLVTIAASLKRPATVVG